MMLAVPSNTPGGLEAGISGHFGHCDLFTLINIQEGKIAAVDTVANLEHGAGGCVAPVNLLRDKGVGAVVVGGLGARPMQAFADAGIAVYYADKSLLCNVKDAVSGLLAGKFPKMQPEQICKGSGHCHH
ncbi:NifB/NifX family molybdenum-iron cluster-binding protein [Desulfobulbus sp. F4]|nr:NifB/NifX family molybdenum-iron cluster-binding protein [Desulfobulbus sp. F3]MCW5201100.1 NifB/NifX family molybdenum-iron cluster-binding protein [Desulfobulbus sp. F4]